MKFYLSAPAALLTVLLSSTALWAAVDAIAPAPAAVAAAPTTQNFGRNEKLLSELPPEKAKLFKETLSQSRSKNTALRAQIDKLEQDVATIMVAESFDKASYLAKNTEISKLYNEMKKNSSEAIASVAEKFTQADRKVLEKMHQKKLARSPKS
jgi:uncharacterized membrane protein